MPVFQGPCIEDVNDSAIADNLSANKFGAKQVQAVSSIKHHKHHKHYQTSSNPLRNMWIEFIEFEVCLSFLPKHQQTGQREVRKPCERPRQPRMMQPARRHNLLVAPTPAEQPIFPPEKAINNRRILHHLNQWHAKIQTNLLQQSRIQNSGAFTLYLQTFTSQPKHVSAMLSLSSLRVLARRFLKQVREHPFSQAQRIYVLPGEKNQHFFPVNSSLWIFFLCFFFRFFFLLFVTALVLKANPAASSSRSPLHSAVQPHLADSAPESTGRGCKT